MGWWAVEDTAMRPVDLHHVEAGEHRVVPIAHRFCNTGIVTVRGAQIVEVEVYFGWDLPHKPAVGGFVEEA